MDVTYWKTRHQMMEEGEYFGGVGGEVMSSLDVSMDRFDPNDDRSPDDIDETQLRVELLEAMERLRTLGLLDDS
jgi:hypothetical protein